MDQVDGCGRPRRHAAVVSVTERQGDTESLSQVPDFRCLSGGTVTDAAASATGAR